MATKKEEMRIKIIKDGPYRVTGGLPLYEQAIVTDEAGHTRELIDKKEYPRRRPMSCAVAAHPKISPSVMEPTGRSVSMAVKRPAENPTWKKRRHLLVLN